MGTRQEDELQPRLCQPVAWSYYRCCNLDVMKVDTESLTNETLRVYARLAERYLVALWLIDQLEPVSSITLGDQGAKKKESLELLGSLARFSVSENVLLAPVVEDHPGRQRKNPLTPTTPLELLVTRCRRLGASWAEIGKRLGMSQQGAHKAYASFLDEGPEN